MAAQRPNKRQLKRELHAVRPYSRSRIADAARHQLALHSQMAADHLQYLLPSLSSPWQTWAQQALQAAHPADPALCSSTVLGMDIPLLQRLAAELPQPCSLYVHSLSDTQALVFNDAGHCRQAWLQQSQIEHWQAHAIAPTQCETHMRAADATALHAAWQSFAQEMNCPANLSQFSAQVFDAGVQSQRLVCITPITLDWMSPYENIHTQCLWFNGVSRIMDGAEILHTMGHGRD